MELYRVIAEGIEITINPFVSRLHILSFKKTILNRNTTKENSDNNFSQYCFIVNTYPFYGQDKFISIENLE